MWIAKQLIPILGTLALLLPTGCQQSTTDEAIAKFRTVHPEPVNVAIGPRLAALTDQWKYNGVTGTFPTGHVAAEIFNGGPACPWTVELLSSQLTLEQTAGEVMAFFRTTSTYHITCLLIGPDGKTPLHASRTGASGASADKAATLAVGGALDDIAGQVRVCIPQPSGTNTRSTTRGFGTALPDPQ